MSIKNPFAPDSGWEQKLKRNPRDLSHYKLFTTEFGRGTPVLCQEVVSSDTIRIENVQLDIQGMPTIFPILSPINVSVSYYYCRNRCVHNQFEDFCFNTKNIEKPWIRMNADRAKRMISTGSLGDFLGVPSTIGTESSVTKSLFNFSRLYTIPIAPDYFYDSDHSVVRQRTIDYLLNLRLLAGLVPLENGYTSTSSSSSSFIALSTPVTSLPSSLDLGFVIPFEPASSSSNILDYFIGVVAPEGRIYDVKPCSMSYYVSSGSGSARYVFSNPYSLGYLQSLIDGSGSFRFLIGCNFISYSDSVYSSSLYFVASGNKFSWIPMVDARSTISPVSIPVVFDTSSLVDATDSSVISQNIYVGADPKDKLDAWAFRHYQMIGNYFFRNDKNNPFILNGEVQYNEFVSSKDSGPDDNVYDFFYRNWELDRFTSATQSPQFGDAPLVGLTYNPLGDSAVLTFQATDENGDPHDYKVRVGVRDDYSISDIADFDKNIPSATLRKVTDMIAYGVSINDFRVTNSFQRFLERTLKRGLRYRNQVKSHFGVSVDYPDIDVPQYIGGFSGRMNASRNENMAASEYANLGDFNGSLFGNFQLQHPITLQVPENGYIIGIMTITPTPCYPQALTNPALIKRSPFDYFLPEFGKIGHVPLTYHEVMPLQNGVGQSPDDVFGYQRPWYDYLSNLDELHGDFRTTLRNFTTARMFASRPDLGQDFTVVNPEDVNQIFITENIADKYGSNAKFICRITYGMKAMRPMPDGMPSLE